MITDVISINTDEYKELVVKATKYDQLRKVAERASFLTDFERAVYEIPAPEVAFERAVYEIPEATKDESEGEA